MVGRTEDAHKAFSAAVQMHDTLVKAWALWGDYMEQQFTKGTPNIATGVAAITCFLHACRHQNESKSRKYLAKVSLREKNFFSQCFHQSLIYRICFALLISNLT